MDAPTDCQAVLNETAVDSIKHLKALIAEKDQEIIELVASLEKQQFNASRSLQDTHDFYESILTLLPCSVYWLDKNNVYLGCNDLQAKDAQLKSRKEVIGKTNFDLLSEEEAIAVNNLNTTVMDSGQTHTAEEYAVMANGLTVYLSSKTPLRNANNQVIGLLGVSVDITEQKKMEAALQRAKEKSERDSQAKTEFIVNANHDFSPSLRAIVALSELMAAETNTEKEKDYAICIYQCSKQLLNLFHEVVDSVSAAKIDDNSIQITPLCLSQIIQDISYLLLPMLKLKYLSLQIQLSPAIPQNLFGDANKLKKILLYLLGKIIEYSDNYDNLQFIVDAIGTDASYLQLQFAIVNTGMNSKNQDYKSDCNDMKLAIAEKYIGLLGGELEQSLGSDMRPSFQFTLSFKID